MIDLFIIKLSGTAVVATIMVLLAAIYFFALWLRKRYNTTTCVENIHKKRHRQETMMRRRTMAFSLLMSIAIVIVTMAWTQYNRDPFVIPKVEFDFSDISDVDQQSDVMPNLPPPAEIPPPDVKTPEITSPTPESPKPIDPTPVITPKQEVIVTTPSPPSTSAPSNPTPSPTTDNVPKEKIYQIVQDMPTFPGCEEFSDPLMKEDCTKRKLGEFIQSNLRYPDQAIKNNTQGTVKVSFVVDKEGTITQVTASNDIGDGCAAAAIDVTKKLNGLARKMKPGRQGGQAVMVRYNIPVKFKLTEIEKKAKG
jgi:TonB family protein